MKKFTNFLHFKNFSKNSNGITLVALVVTIVVLLILAGITITMLFSDNGIIKKAQEAANKTADDKVNTEQGLSNLESSMNSALGIRETVDITSTAITTTSHETVNVKDSLGNIFVLPKGFRIVKGSSDSLDAPTYADPNNPTVQDGIVISDSNDTNGNEFVWIPVGNVNIKNADNTTATVNIELARYNFTTSDSTVEGSRTVEQSASNYATDTPFTPTGLSWQVIEYAKSDTPDGVASKDSTGRNAIAKDLAGFITSASTNKGYYLARYEASEEERTEGENTTKIPASKYNKTTWTGVTQINSALASRVMYKDNDTNVGVKSDLVNSYAWDTTIIYIEKMKTENNNYANTKQGGDTSTKSDKLNTGKHNDKVCNIHDMSGNVLEWSTEYSTYSDGSIYYPCVRRGGYCYSSDHFTASRSGNNATHSGIFIGFRPALWIK